MDFKLTATGDEDKAVTSKVRPSTRTTYQELAELSARPYVEELFSVKYLDNSSITLR